MGPFSKANQKSQKRKPGRVSALVLLLSAWIGATPSFLARGDDDPPCTPVLSSELTHLLAPRSRSARTIDLSARTVSRIDPARKAAAPLDESIDLRRLINEEDWVKATLEPETRGHPWLFYGEKTARDWMDTARWVADGADGRPIDLALLEEIHRRATRTHFFIGAENRRIIAAEKARGTPKEEYLEICRTVIRDKTSPVGTDHARYRGTLRSEAIDDLAHDGSLQLPGGKRVFSRQEFELMSHNPYMRLDPENRPEISADGLTVRARFRYTAPDQVEDSARVILQKLNEELNHARTNEDVILAVVRMNRQLLAAHPFLDGNGRTVRLLGDLVFQRYGLPPPLFPNERDLEMTDSEAVQFILRGMNASLEAKHAH